MDSIERKPSTTATLDAVIIGAGFAGLYQLHCLRDRLALSVQVLEAADDLGGTWHWNRYPGARCDSESHAYNYFFSKELLEEWSWSERYPEQPEIIRYLDFVATKFDLRRSIRFDTRVIAARFDAPTQRWSIETANGDRYLATYLISAVGCLSAANVPAIPGLDRFAGQWVHTGEWPKGGVDFAGKRVGQIGTGSTGIQAAPVIARTAAHLIVFQRTANYSVPSRNAPLTAEFKRYVREHHDEIAAIVHSTPNGHAFRIAERKVFDVTDAEREKIYEDAWETGGLQFRASFQDILFDQAANDTAAQFLKNKIRAIVRDPKTAAILANIDHPYAAKRPPIDTGYFETFNRSNVSLVNLRADPIECITPQGIKTRNAEHPLDIIVFATGYDAMTGPLLRMDIRGRDGLSLRDLWRDGPKTYLGLQMPGFPNLFTVTGPGSPSVLSNMPVSIEQHVEWITECIAYLRRNGLATIEASAQATHSWGEHVNEVANLTLLPTVPHSWYLGANVAGKPRVFMPYAGGLIRYRAICDDVVSKQYEGFITTRSGSDRHAGSNGSRRQTFAAITASGAPGV